MGLWQSSDDAARRADRWRLQLGQSSTGYEPTERASRQRLHDAADMMDAIKEFLYSRECAVAVTHKQSLCDREQVLFLLHRRMRYVPQNLYDAAALAHYTTRWLHLRILCREWCVPREVESYAVAYYLAMATRRETTLDYVERRLANAASMATQGT